MNVEEFTGITNQIAQNLNNQALVTELLTQLNDGFGNVRTTFDSLQQQQETYQKEINELQKTNMNLFLKVSQKPIASDTINNKEPLTYENVIKTLGV
jgi:hypothetical protein